MITSYIKISNTLTNEKKHKTHTKTNLICEDQNPKHKKAKTLSWSE